MTSTMWFCICILFTAGLAHSFVLTPDHVVSVTESFPVAFGHVLTNLHMPSVLSIDALAPTLTPAIREGERLIVDDVGGAYETLKMAMVPAKFGNAAAGILAESAAGAIGGLISRGTANVLGDKKYDSLGTKMSSTGIYFGARQVAVTCLNRIIGVPRPLALLLAALLSSLIKIERRATEAAAIEQRQYDATLKGYYLVDGDVIINMSPPAAKHLAHAEEVAASTSAPAAAAAAEPEPEPATAALRPHWSRSIPGQMRLRLPMPMHMHMHTPHWTSHYAGEGEYIVNLDPPAEEGVVQPSKHAFFKALTAPAEWNGTESPEARPGVAPVGTAVAPPPSPPSKRRIISLPEVLGDVSKWMVFDALAVNQDWAARTAELAGVELNTLYFLFGTTAALSGKLVHDVTEAVARDNDSHNATAFPVGAVEAAARRSTLSTREVRTRETVRYGTAAVEGGVLFGTYEAALSTIQRELPADWNKPFLFEELLEQVESVVKDAIVLP